jgi:hypothetical protein
VGLSTDSEERLRVFATGGVSIGNTTDPGAANLSVTGTLLLAQSYDQSTGALQVTGNANINGSVNNKSLNLQGNNNSLLYSQDFTQGSWAKTSVTVGAAITAPDGTTTANSFTATSSDSYLTQSPSPALITGLSYTFSIWLKAASATTIGIGIGNLYSTVSVTTTWQRFSKTVTYDASGSRVIIGGFSTFPSTSPVIYAWQAQLEYGSSFSGTTLTTSAAIATTNNVNIPNGSITVIGGNINIQRPIATTQVAPTIASSATIAPTAYITFISGITTINTITAPSPLSTYGGQLVLIPTGLWSTGVTGNIAIATVGVVSKALTMTYDKTAALWYPSY